MRLLRSTVVKRHVRGGSITLRGVGRLHVRPGEGTYVDEGMGLA